MATIPEALAIAIQRHQSGALQAAEQIYRQILQVEPNHADATHLLGVIAHQVGQHQIAAEHIARAIALNGGVADFHNNLANVYRALGRIAQAVACYRRAVELKPDLAEAHSNLGDGLMEQGLLDEAIVSFRRAIELKPDLAEAHNNLGAAFARRGKWDEAMACYRRALALRPDYPEALNNLGNVCKEQGRLEEAVAHYRRALELKAEYSAAHHNLGDAYRDQGQIEDSIACYRRALALKPASVESMVNLGEVFRRRGMLGEAAASATRALELNPGLAEAHNNLGSAFKDQGNIVEAEACFHRALELKPGLAEAHDNLGLVYRDQGKLDQALAAFRRALELKPGSPGTHSNLLFAQILHPGFDAAALYEEHLQWNQRHAAPLAKLAELHRRDRAPDRRLRIGYVSPAFCHHVVGRNLLPLFREHDHRQLEIFCYSDAPRPDELTDQFRRDADVWRECAGRPDEKLAEWIRHDQIDIMVDLSVHSDGNRLLLFARRPAPLQVTFAGYPGTTGLSAIDYRLTDPYLDPPGLFDHFYSEQSIRLPDSFWCYDPQESDPSVNGLPAAEKRYITFGCLNNFCKVNPVVLALWAQVLRAVEGSQLIVLAGQGRHREDTLRLLEAEGVDRRRVTFTARRPRSQYLSCYHEIDIGLDTVPYNGHTTSLDSFWMGVPIVTLVGSTVVGRAGLSQLTNLGLQELIATSPEKYVQIAATLAQDRPRISALRSTLRERMEASPLMDAPRFARGIEAAYRQIWREWCAA